jgi:hypothetical protein
MLKRRHEDFNEPISPKKTHITVLIFLIFCNLYNQEIECLLFKALKQTQM